MIGRMKGARGAVKKAAKGEMGHAGVGKPQGLGQKISGMARSGGKAIAAEASGGRAGGMFGKSDAPKKPGGRVGRALGRAKRGA